jgi:hypothetical protein
MSPAAHVGDLVFNEPVDGVWATDHFGLAADLQKPAKPVGTW